MVVQVSMTCAAGNGCGEGFFAVGVVEVKLFVVRCGCCNELCIFLGCYYDVASGLLFGFFYFIFCMFEVLNLWCLLPYTCMYRIVGFQLQIL